MRTPAPVLAVLLAACAPDTGPPRPAEVAADTGPAPGLVPTARLAVPPPLSLRAFHDDGGALDSIHVLRGGRRVQSLLPVGEADPAPAPGTDVDTTDINLDGFPDVRQQVIWGASGNAAFNWWLFDADSGRYVYSPEYSQRVLGYRVDREARRIRVRSHGGHAGAIFEEDTYEPRGRELVLVHSVQQTWEPELERYLRTTREISGGEWLQRVDTFTVETLPAPEGGRPGP